jgi:hypothetical protein
MAQHLDINEIRNYPVGTGTADLIKLISADRPSSWVRAQSLADLPVGTVAYVAAMGKMRRGVVVKVGRTKASVAFTTQGAVDEVTRANEFHRGQGTEAWYGIRVQTTAAEPETIFIAPKPLPEPVAEVETELVPLTVDVEAITRRLQDEAAEDEASAVAQAQTDQVEGWLARHREAGTPRTQWSPAEDARQADHAEALAIMDEERWKVGAIIDAEEQAYREEDARQAQAWIERVSDHVCRTGYRRADAERMLIEDDHAEALTLNSQAGKVTGMNNDAATQTLTQINDDILATEVQAQVDAAHAEALAQDKIREVMEAGTAFIPAWMKDDQDKAAAEAAHTEALEVEAAETEVAPIIRETTGSAVVQLLERVWTRIRQNHPELPAVVIVTGAGLGIMGGKWGHFRPNGWTAKVAEEGAATSSRLDEMFMAGETLAKGARQVLQTMLHEGAHTLAKVREVQDTSRQGRWHNAKFRTLAEEMGLEYRKGEASKTLGFSEVTLTDKTVTEYADLLAALDAEIHLMVSLPGWLGGDAGQDGGENMGKAPKAPAAPSNGTNIKATCLCEEPNIVRMSRKVLDKCVVMCEECNERFLDRS